MFVSNECLNRFSYKAAIGDRVLIRNIATGDESWVHHYDLENERQSMEYRHPGSPSVKKFKTVSPAKQFMLTIFWDARACFARNFWLKDRRWIRTGVVQSYDHSSNASAESGRKETRFFCIPTTPHCSAQTQDAMTSLKFTVVPHPPYSPDWAPSDFWLLPKFKETLKGQHFLSDAEVEAAVCKWIST